MFIDFSSIKRLKYEYKLRTEEKFMSNEEFQELVLQKLSNLEARQNEMFKDISDLKTDQEKMQHIQETMLQKLSDLETRQDEMQHVQEAMLQKLSDLETRQDEMQHVQEVMLQKLSNLETRQNEIYQVVRAVEHSNIIGKAELDDHNIRISRNEGTLKKIAKVIEDELNKAANL